MSDRRYEVREVGACGCGLHPCPFGPILDSIPDALVEEAAKRIWERRHDTPYRPDRARHNRYHADYAADARAALSVLFPGEEEE